MTSTPLRHSHAVATVGSDIAPSQPVCVLDTHLANRFAGLSVINEEFLSAREMLIRLPAQSDHFVRSALWRAAVAIYARGFASAGRGMPRLEERDHLAGAPADLLKLHQFLLIARHNFLSHAGGSSLERSTTHVVLTDPKVGKGVETIMAVRSVRSDPPLTEVEDFVRLLTFVIEAVTTSTKQAHQRVRAEVEALDIDKLYERAHRLSGA